MGEAADRYGLSHRFPTDAGDERLEDHRERDAVKWIVQLSAHGEIVRCDHCGRVIEN